MDITRGRKDSSDVERELEELKSDIEQNGFVASTEELHIYVSAANGNDNNDGLTAATPVATLTRAYQIMPYALAAPCVVHLGSGTYAAASLDGRAQVGVNARIWLYGDGAGQAGDDGFVEQRAPELAQSGSGTQVVVTTGGMVAGAHAGQTIEIVSGPGAGERRMIGENTTTDIIPLADFATAPTTASTFRIVSTGIFIDTDPVVRRGLFTRLGSLSSSFNILPFLGLVNMEFTGTNPGGVVSLPAFSNCGVLMHNVTQSAFGMDFAQCVLNCGETKALGIQGSTVTFNPYEELGFDTTRGPLWDGWGVSTPGGGFAFKLFNSKCSGFFQSAGQLIFGEQSSVELKGTKAAGLLAQSGAFVRLNSAGSPAMKFEGSDAAGTVIAQDGAVIQNGGPGHIINNTGSGPCLHAILGGLITWASAFTIPTGSSTGGPGMKASGGKIVFEDAAPLITGSTPGTNDAELDNGTVAGNASFSGAGTGISNLGSVIQRTV